MKTQAIVSVFRAVNDTNGNPRKALKVTLIGDTVTDVKMVKGTVYGTFSYEDERSVVQRMAKNGDIPPYEEMNVLYLQEVEITPKEYNYMKKR